MNNIFKWLMIHNIAVIIGFIIGNNIQALVDSVFLFAVYKRIWRQQK